MKTAIKLIVIIYISASMLAGCHLNFKRGNGDIQTEEIELDDFTKVSIGGNYEVLLTKSEYAGVTIETDENLLRYINTEVHNETLNINNVHNLKGSQGIKVEIRYRNIDKIYSTGASEINHDDLFVSEELSLNLSGAGSIEMEIQTQRVDVNLTGAGAVILSGRAEYQEAQISGVGGLSAIELVTSESTINLSGLGGAEVYVTEKLEATITGIGGIQYAGNPKNIERQVTGLGKITRADRAETYRDEGSSQLPSFILLRCQFIAGARYSASILIVTVTPFLAIFSKYSSFHATFPLNIMKS